MCNKKKITINMFQTNSKRANNTSSNCFFCNQK